MFFVEIIEAIGKPPIRLEASQVVVRMANGTPVSVAAMFGGPHSVMVSHCEDSGFNANLQKLGINETVISSRLKV
jgi:hypothetical protein